MHLSDFNCWFSPYYSDDIVGFFAKTRVLNFSILGGQFRQKTEEYIFSNNINPDIGGKDRQYDLVITCSDLIIPQNILKSKIILVQEGMTDPENLIYHLVKRLRLPRWLASTSTTSLSNNYDYFCVASEGFKNLFINKGIDGRKIKVTGIPNFDNCAEYRKNDFPYRGYVLAATSDSRETYKIENRKKFIEKVNKIAKERPIIFKLHPNELVERATEEINKYSPGAIIYSQGNTEQMIANCSILVIKYSSCVFVGLALGKEVYSDFNIDDLKRLTPLQNGGRSAFNISQTARLLLSEYVQDHSSISKTGHITNKDRLIKVK
jgi:hypothetical protein